MPVFISLAILLITTLIVYTIKRRRAWPAFPSPPANFFFGHTLEIKSSTILESFTKYVEICGPTFGMQLGPFKKTVISQDYRLIETILNSTKDMNKSDNYSFFRPWLGDGLLLSNGSHWKMHRKIITPAFHFEILKEFMGVFERVGNILVEKLEKCRNPENVDLYPYINLCTLDIICETAMGTRVDAQINENSSYVRAVKRICQIIIGRSLSALTLNDFLFSLTRDSQEFKKVLNTLHNHSYSVIRNNLEKKDETKDENKKKKMAFLDLLLKYSNNQQLLSLREIREEVDTFMFEGHDTTGTAISFALFSLATNPEVQEKVLTEQRELFGNKKRPEVTYNDLQNMKYLELVIKETLRLFPPVPFIARRIQSNIICDNVVIPEQTNVALNIYGIHRDPQYFPDPEKFNPDRFLELDGSPFAYVPFSAGLRNCIGQKFAMLEMKSTISKIIRHFQLVELTPKHNLQLVSEIVLKSANGVRVAIRKRD